MPLHKLTTSIFVTGLILVKVNDPIHRTSQSHPAVPIIFTMHALTILTALASAASALPSLATREPEPNNNLEARAQRILIYTIETWPEYETMYNNQSYEFFFVTPKGGDNYHFSFQNSNAANSGIVDLFTVTGEGLETIKEEVHPPTATGRDVVKTGKPFTITIDRL